MEKINYTWGFPFKLFVDYKAKRVIIRTLEDAKLFIDLLDKENKPADRPAGNTIAIYNSPTTTLRQGSGGENKHKG